MLPSQIFNRIKFNFSGERLEFDTSLKLFSHSKIDEGTKEILNSLRKNKEINYEKILDLGCGYGPIGIFLKKQNPLSIVEVSDRDYLALEFAKHNSDLNNVEISKFTPSLDFSTIEDKDFSLIVCNFPAKLEKEGLKNFIYNSSNYLKKEGILAIVVVKELKESFQEILSELNKEKIRVRVNFKENSNNYVVYHLSFFEKLNYEFDYSSNEVDFKISNKNFQVITFMSSKEEEYPSLETKLLLEILSKNKIFKDMALINPGTGFLAVSAAQFDKDNYVKIISRDLLQIEFSIFNLLNNNLKNKISAFHTDLIEEKGEILIWSLSDEGFNEILEKLEIYKNNFRKILIAGNKNLIKKVIKKVKFKLETEMSFKNISAVSLLVEK